MKKITSILLIIAFMFGLSGCFFDTENPFPYRGEYKELYTTAIYSIPDAEGYMHHGEGAYSSDIYIWEQDEYGRTLFSYCEDYGNQVFALVICQSYDEENVYFYPEVNYILTLIDSKYSYEGVEDDHLKNRTEEFYLEKKEKLKEANDWNKPLDETKYVSYSITDHKVFGEDIYSLSKEECNEILNEYTKTLNLDDSSNRPHRYNTVLQVDAEGKILHEIHGICQDYWIFLWVITDKEGNYDKENGVIVMYSKGYESRISFIYDASTILEFKNKNGWKY
ncbi:MAG: hypothetical protein E7283_08290 [Lachnospiraceae bacterium]|nr:hypothetical protein [Lachnospiraceae bacterium]